VRNPEYDLFPTVYRFKPELAGKQASSMLTIAIHRLISSSATSVPVVSDPAKVSSNS
jgi:hypothetical protein